MNDRRRRTTSVVVAAFVLAMIPALATAGHDASTVASYTGCLSSRGGAVYNLAEGQITSDHCKSGDTQIHLSGGDITGVLPGDGLIGGSTQGTAGLAVDTAVIQTRVAGACAVGSAIREIAGDGAVTCEEVEGTDVSQPGGDGTAIHGSHLQDASVELVKLAADVLTEAEFQTFISRLATPTSADDVVFLVDASRIGGTIGNSQIASDLSASKIASGTLDPARLPTIRGSMVTTLDADGLTGSNIQDFSLSTRDLALGAITGQAVPVPSDPGTNGNIASGTITGEGSPDYSDWPTGNIALRTIGGRNLALGAVSTLEIDDAAVTTSKQTANTSTTVGGDVALSEGIPEQEGTAVIETLSAQHKVFVNGQAVVSMGSCVSGPCSANFSYQLVRDPSGTPVGLGPVYNGVVTDEFTTVPLPLSALDVPSAGTHTYGIEVELLTTNGSPTVHLQQPAITVIDLGR